MDAPPPLLNQTLSPSAGQAQRHGCLVAWLVFVCLVYGGLILLNLVGLMSESAATAIKSKGGGATEAPWITVSYLALSSLALLSAVLVFFRMKAGFFALVFFALCMAVIDVVFLQSVANALLHIVLILALFGTLRMGGENSWWKQLK